VPVKDDQIKSVATISSESEDIGSLIAEVIEKVGKNVPIYIEDNRFADITYEVVEGLETKVGYAHNVFVTNPKEGTAEMKDVAVFACSRKIGSIPDIQTLLMLCDAQKITSLVFLVSDMDTSVLGALAANKMQGHFNSLVIRALGAELEDMAAACGATLISEQSGIKLKDVTAEHLGFVKKIVSDQKKTLIVAGESKIRTEAIAMLRTAVTNTKNIYEAKNYNRRADALQGGVAIIKVGAHTDSEREYLKYKIEDAVNATKSALEEGLVEGGGMALYRLSNRIKSNSVGDEILKRAMKAPLKAIIENAGKDYTQVIKGLPNGKGYDASNDKYVKMFEKGIVDPSKVVRCAFQNALSTAGTFITMEVAIADKEVKDISHISNSRHI